MSMEWNRNLYERIRAAADRGKHMTPRAYAAILPQLFHPCFC